MSGWTGVVLGEVVIQGDAPRRSSGSHQGRRLIGVAAVALLAIALFAAYRLEGWPDAVRDTGELARGLLVRFGPGFTFVDLYLEESGLPMPVPGDVFILYLGHQLASSMGWLVAAWLGIIAVVVAGASNLYLASRRWGRQLVEGRFGLLLHLPPDRLQRAEQWFQRWGPLAIIFGRHVFGLRVPMSVAGGVLRVPYPVFAVSVAISAAPWAAFWLWIGIHYGGRLGTFLQGHWWAYLLFPAALVLVTMTSPIEAWWRRWRARRRPR